MIADLSHKVQRLDEDMGSRSSRSKSSRSRSKSRGRSASNSMSGSRTDGIKNSKGSLKDITKHSSASMKAKS